MDDARAPLAGLRLTTRLESWRLTKPFRITGHVFNETPVLAVELSDGTRLGRGEAAGVYYRGDTPARALALIETVRDAVEGGVTRDDVQHLLPPGAARNALDCALWDLESQRAGAPVWKLAGLPPPRPLLTNFTIGAGTPAEMEATAQGRGAAQGYAAARAIKLKLTGDEDDAARVRTVRAGRPDVALAVDANQGFTPETLGRLMPVLLDCGVTLVEQPFPLDKDNWLDGVARPIPFAADESAQTDADLERLRGRVDVINIKLDKCGGLTAGLFMLAQARARGFGVMVGNMTGTSLAMAPAFVLGQLCDIVDLDGPVFLAEDRSPELRYQDGMITFPQPIWGGIRA